MEEKELIQNINQSLDIQLPDQLRMEQLVEELAAHINQMIIHDFPRLVQLLYRIDVSEQKLKNLLRENKEKDAGLLIAHLIIERQLQKIKLRRKFGRKEGEGDW